MSWPISKPSKGAPGWCGGSSSCATVSRAGTCGERSEPPRRRPEAKPLTARSGCSTRRAVSKTWPGWPPPTRGSARLRGGKRCGSSKRWRPAAPPASRSRTRPGGGGSGGGVPLPTRRAEPRAGGVILRSPSLPTAGRRRGGRPPFSRRRADREGVMTTDDQRRARGTELVSWVGELDGEGLEVLSGLRDCHLAAPESTPRIVARGRRSRLAATRSPPGGSPSFWRGGMSDPPCRRSLERRPSTTD